jgi:hypothetical protein
VRVSPPPEPDLPGVPAPARAEVGTAPAVPVPALILLGIAAVLAAIPVFGRMNVGDGDVWSTVKSFAVVFYIVPIATAAVVLYHRAAGTVRNVAAGLALGTAAASLSSTAFYHQDRTIGAMTKGWWLLFVAGTMTIAVILTWRAAASGWTLPRRAVAGAAVLDVVLMALVPSHTAWKSSDAPIVGLCLTVAIAGVLALETIAGSIGGVARMITLVALTPCFIDFFGLLPDSSPVYAVDEWTILVVILALSLLFTRRDDRLFLLAARLGTPALYVFTVDSPYSLGSEFKAMYVCTYAALALLAVTAFVRAERRT